MTLDERFGECAPPVASQDLIVGNGLKSHEVDIAGRVRKPNSRTILDANAVAALMKCQELSHPALTSPIPRSAVFLWLVDEVGNFVMAIEELTNGEVKPRTLKIDGLEALGHPTLVDGKPARIGGELHFESGEWWLTNRSGRYCRNRGWSDKRILNFLKNVAEVCKNVGLEVQCKAV